mmetsp:Transcript_13334/g.28333  ORF Transcript_13334/g.28333 Transcript_13334/m.28333 type:complete len:250 (+) Transcript_13334:460-1209(+)
MSNDKHVARIEANRPSTSCKVSTSSPSEQGETTPEGAKDAAGAVRASQVRSARRSAQRSRAWREYVWVEVAGNRLPRLEAAVEARSFPAVVHGASAFHEDDIVAAPARGVAAAALALATRVARTAVHRGGVEDEDVAGLHIPAQQLVLAARGAGVDVRDRLERRGAAIHVLRRVVASRKVRDGVAQLPLVRAAHVAEAATGGHHVECEPDGADLLALEWPVRGVVVPRRRRARPWFFHEELVVEDVGAA